MDEWMIRMDGAVGPMLGIYACRCIQVCARLSECPHVHVYDRFACACACVCVCMYVCMYVCICIFLLSICLASQLSTNIYIYTNRYIYIYVQTHIYMCRDTSELTSELKGRHAASSCGVSFADSKL